MRGAIYDRLGAPIAKDQENLASSWCRHSA
jgi:hypothetical protein